MNSGPIIIVGAGLTGASIARDLADAGLKITVLERGPEVGGNCKEGVKLGRPLHLHGPHLFHTSDESIWEFVQRFGDWRRYEHKVVALVGGRMLPIPVNLNTVRAMRSSLEIEESELVDFCGSRKKTTVLRLLSSKNPRINALGKFVFENFFEGYSKKQWGAHFENLDDSVLSRVPIRASFDDRYFDDKFQALPVLGYSKLIAKMLDHPNIEVILSRNFSRVDLEKFAMETVVFTGAIDDLIASPEEKLPYRSLEFKYVLESPSEHGLTHMQTNYPNDHAYTRVTNYSHIFGTVNGVDLLAYEYPSEQTGESGDKYYPIPTEANSDTYKMLLSRLTSGFPNMWVAGRLGDYKYYNMDQAIARGRKLAKDLVANLETKE